MVFVDSWMTARKLRRMNVERSHTPENSCLLCLRRLGRQRALCLPSHLTLHVPYTFAENSSSYALIALLLDEVSRLGRNISYMSLTDANIAAIASPLSFASIPT